MASYVNLFLDLTAPTTVVLTAPGSSGTLAVSVSGSTADATTTGYKMKFWGATVVTNAVAGDTEANAPYLTYSTANQTVTFASEGSKTLNFAVYDDVGNRTAATPKSINIVTSLPTVTVDQISGGVNPNLPTNDAGKFSVQPGYNTLTFRFQSNLDIIEWKVMKVANTGDLVGTGQAIGTTNGSTVGAVESITAGTFKSVTIKMADFDTQVTEAKIVKVFVKNVAGNWSEA
jgi:hypothetical protein